MMLCTSCEHLRHIQFMLFVQWKGTKNICFCMGDFVLVFPTQTRTYKSRCSLVRKYRSHGPRQPF